MLENILIKINQERREKNFSQYYMASQLNISQSYYNKIEKGKTEVSFKKVIDILSILNLKLSELVSK